MIRILREMMILGIAAFLVIYLINPTAGIVELIPDVMPFIGNLDEATATLLLLRILAYYGVNVSWFTGQHKLPPPRDQ